MKNGSLRKQPTFRDATTGFLEMTSEETSAEIPYWWRVTATIYVVLLIGRAATRHQYGISAVVSQTSGVAECRLLSQARKIAVE